MSSKTIQYIGYALKAGLFILPALSLIVPGDLFFPFITGKNFFFRIAVEILLFGWVFAACFDKNYRPRKSPVLIALAATLFFLALATIFGANPYRSFWSNFERMEGLITHIHLFLYFLIIASVFRKARDWKWLFIAMLGVSLIVTIYGFLQFFHVLAIHQGDIRLDATFGNATYLAIFLIFHLFLIGLLFTKIKNIYARSGLIILFALETAVIFFTATRGAILGLIGGAVIFSLLTLLHKNKKLRYAGLGVFLSLAALVSLFFAFRNSSFIQNNFVLSRFAGISFSERTVESRFTIWKMSLQGFLERPLLGWGPDNYNLVFNKYYQPELWPQEPWFDRSHNIIFDWLISAGIMGFLAYWSIFGAAIYIILKGYRKKYFTLAEMGLFFGLLSAYIFHNLFVFDNLTSYFMFFTILGYLHFRHLETGTRIGEEKEELKTGKEGNREIGLAAYLLITLTFIFVVFSLYFANIKPILANKQLIATLGEGRVKGADVNFMLQEFNKVFSYNTFANNESAEQMSSYADQVIGSSSISSQDKMEVVAKTVERLKRQIASGPNDARTYLFLTALYNKSGQYDVALQTAMRALELSPKKQQIHFIIADIYLATGQNEKAFEILQKAHDLDPSYPEAVKNFIIAAALNKKQDLTEKLLAEFEKLGTKRSEMNKYLLNVYASIGDWQKVKGIWLDAIKGEPDNAQYHVSLAATYLKLADRKNAIKELEAAISLNPQFKEQGDYYINEIKAGRNP